MDPRYRYVDLCTWYLNPDQLLAADSNVSFTFGLFSFTSFKILALSPRIRRVNIRRPHINIYKIFFNLIES